MGGGQEGSHLQVPTEPSSEPLCQPLDLGLLASRAVRKKNVYCCGMLLLQQPSQTTFPFRPVAEVTPTRSFVLLFTVIWVISSLRRMNQAGMINLVPFNLSLYASSLVSHTDSPLTG